jgi:hypothetical protein
MCTKKSNFPWIMKRLEFPVQLAFAITFNRGQSRRKIT